MGGIWRSERPMPGHSLPAHDPTASLPYVISDDLQSLWLAEVAPRLLPDEPAENLREILDNGRIQNGRTKDVDVFFDCQDNQKR